MKPGKAPWKGAYSDQKPNRVPWRAIAIGVAALAALLVLRQMFIVVQAGERAVVFSKVSGMKPYQLSEGLHFNLPLVWVPTKYDIKTLTYTMSGSGSESHSPGADGQVPDDSLAALTSDGLPVTLDVSVRFHIDPDNVWRLHRNVGPDFVDKVVRPQARAVTRMWVAEFPVVDVYSARRQVIIEKVQGELREKFKNNYLILDEVLLRDIRFPDEFQAAIEQKQVAQQQAQQMVYEVDRARSEKQQRIVAAEGEAAAIRAKANALAQNPQLIPYDYVHQLPNDARIVITDSKSIVSLGDVLGEAPAPRPAAAARQSGEGPQ